MIYVCDNHSEKECIGIVNKYVKVFLNSIIEIYNIDSTSIVDTASISTRLIEK